MLISADTLHNLKMSDGTVKSCDPHQAAMKILIFLLVLSVCDTHAQAQLDDDAQDYAGDDDKPKDDVDMTKDVDAPDIDRSAESDSTSDRKHHHHHHSKRHKYWKATVEFLKKTLNPNTLMQNAWFTEMLRKFSHSEDPPEEEMESEESEEEVHTVMPTRRRRGRPKKNQRPASLEISGLRGIFKKGLRKISTIDKKKLRKKIKLMKRMARKAKKPLKSVVKFYLSSKNQNTGYGNNNYGGNTY